MIRKTQYKEEYEVLADKFDLGLPKQGLYYVEDGGDKGIKALACVRAVLMIEPFIAEGNPLAGKKIWDEIQKDIIEGKIPIVRCFAKPEHIDLYKRLGFYEIGDYIPMEKIFIKEISEGEK